MRYYECVKHLTIRNVPDDLAERLEHEKRERGRSLNQTVLDLLSHAVGLQPGQGRSNGLEAFAGTWSRDEVEELERALTSTRQIDDELWT